MDNFFTSYELPKFFDRTVRMNRIDNTPFWCIGEMSEKRENRMMLSLMYHLLSLLPYENTITWSMLYQSLQVKS